MCHAVLAMNLTFIFIGLFLFQLNESTSLEEVMTLDAKGKLQRQLTDPVAKDTVTVPDGGYTILRLHATNPGTSLNLLSRDMRFPTMWYV